MRLPYKTIGYIGQTLGQAPKVTPKELAEIVRLRGRIASAGEREKALLDEQRAKVAELKGLSEQEAGLYSEASQKAYKVPERGRLGSKDFTTGLVFGGLQALVGPRGTAADTVMTVLGPRKQRLDEQYAEEKSLLDERKAEDERRLRLGVGALKARESGVSGELGLAGSELEDLRSEVRAMRGEQFQREQAAQGQANLDRAFFYNVGRDSILDALRSKEEARAQERHDLDVQLTKDPYAFIGSQAENLARLGLFGGDVSEARRALLSPLINGLSDQELKKYQLEEAKEFAKLLPEKVAFQKWSWEQEKKEAKARLESYLRANRGAPGATVADFRFGQAVKQIDSLQQAIRDAEKGLASEGAKFKDPKLVQDDSAVRGQIKEWKKELLGLQGEANGLRPGAYDTSWSQNDPYLAPWRHFVGGG